MVKVTGTKNGKTVSVTLDAEQALKFARLNIEAGWDVLIGSADAAPAGCEWCRRAEVGGIIYHAVGACEQVGDAIENCEGVAS